MWLVVLSLVGLVGGCWCITRLTRALPGMTCSLSPYMTAVKESVVGSGPILIPGKSLSSRYRIKEVLPVLYCPTSSTIGLASKSGSLRAGETNSWKSYVSSSGSNWDPVNDYYMHLGENLFLSDPSILIVMLYQTAALLRYIFFSPSATVA